MEKQQLTRHFCYVSCAKLFLVIVIRIQGKLHQIYCIHALVFWPCWAGKHLMRRWGKYSMQRTWLELLHCFGCKIVANWFMQSVTQSDPPPKTKSKKKKSKLEGEREGRHTIYVNRQEDERVMTGFATKDNSKEFTLEGNGAYILAEEIPSLTSGYKLALFQSLHCHYPCWGPNLQETKWITIPMKASTSNNWTIGCIMPKLPTTRNRTTPSFPRYINSSIRFSVFQLI